MFQVFKELSRRFVLSRSRAVRSRTFALHGGLDNLGAKDNIYRRKGGIVALAKVVIFDSKMDISVTDFKAHCLDLFREVEERGETVTIRRRGRIVARLEAANGSSSDGKPWERLRALGGSASLGATESLWDEEDFEALR